MSSKPGRFVSFMRSQVDGEEPDPSAEDRALPSSICPLTAEDRGTLATAPVVVARLERGRRKVRVVRRVAYELVLVVPDGNDSTAVWVDSSRLEEEPAAEPSPPRPAPPPAPLEDYEPASSAAARLGCDSRTIRRAICSGELPGICREGRWFAWRPEVDRRVATLREVADRLSVSSLSSPPEASDDDVA